MDNEVKIVFTAVDNASKDTGALLQKIQAFAIIGDSVARIAKNAWAELNKAVKDYGKFVNDAVNKRFLSPEEIENAKKLTDAFENLNRASETLKMSLMTELAPGLTQTAEQMAVMIKYGVVTSGMLGGLQEDFNSGKITLDEYRYGIISLDIALSDVPSAALKTETALYGLGEGAKWGGQQIGGMKTMLDGLKRDTGASDLNFIMSFQGASDNFEEEKTRILGQMTELKDEIIEMQNSWRWSDKQKVPGLQEELMALTGELNDNEAEWQQWQKQTAYSLISTKLLAQGVDLGKILELGEDFGVLDPEVVAQAQAMMEAVSTVDPGNLEQAHKDIMDLVKLDGKTIIIHVEYQSAPPPPSSDSGASSSSSGASSSSSSNNYYSFYGASTSDILAELRA